MCRYLRHNEAQTEYKCGIKYKYTFFIEPRPLSPPPHTRVELFLTRETVIYV